jgi:DivIVA domain-containing protein
MIDLTPIEIRKKKGDFPRSVRGYNVAEVDIFLELVADRLEELVLEARESETRVARLEEELSVYRQREQSLLDALVSAEALREEVRRQAEREAELIRREADAGAEDVRRAALAAVETEREALRRLQARREQTLHSFRQLLERELAELAIMAGAGAERAAERPGAGVPDLDQGAAELLDEVFSE